jgi:hypothetical protein
MVETIVVVAVVSVVLFLAIRSVYRTATGKKEEGPCGGGCSTCPGKSWSDEGPCSEKNDKGVPRP